MHVGFSAQELYVLVLFHLNTPPREAADLASHRRNTEVLNFWSRKTCKWQRNPYAADVCLQVSAAVFRAAKALNQPMATIPTQ